MTTFTNVQTFTVVECATCFIAFGVTADFERKHRESHAAFYCPAGHSCVWRGQTEAERLRAELERAKEATAAAERHSSWARDQQQATERSLIAVKGHRTRLKNRVAHGVCPCCTRSFTNLRRHMTTQHPDFAGEE